jgi:DNA polymerase-3 subunit epsilon
MRFTAIDFETADYGRDSACAVALVRVENGTITARDHRLIRPPRSEFVFSWLHGITWEDVRYELGFGKIWPEMQPLLEDVDYLVAHNAPFDRAVLRACCTAAGLAEPEIPFACTVRMARDVWGIFPTRLNNVCDRLGIPLQHHNAASDAEACARIAVAALNDGYRL